MEVHCNCLVAFTISHLSDFAFHFSDRWPVVWIKNDVIYPPYFVTNSITKFTVGYSDNYNSCYCRGHILPTGPFLL